MSWTPSSPHEPRDDTRDDTVYNVPVGPVSHPPRFPGFLLAAVIAALIAFAALGATLFSNRPEAPAASGSPRPTDSGLASATTPGSTAGPGPSRDPGQSGLPDPGPSASLPPASAALVDEVCTEPVAAAGGVRESLIEAFRGYCREGVGAVLAEVDPEPGTVRDLAWGYAADTPPEAGADLSHYVYLALDDQRRIRRYLVVSDALSGQATVTQAGRVEALPADVFFSLPIEES